jgi:hypothetical protein
MKLVSLVLLSLILAFGGVCGAPAEDLAGAAAIETAINVMAFYRSFIELCDILEIETAESPYASTINEEDGTLHFRYEPFDEAIVDFYIEDGALESAWITFDFSSEYMLENAFRILVAFALASDEEMDVDDASDMIDDLIDELEYSDDFGVEVSQFWYAGALYRMAFHQPYIILVYIP